MSCVYAILTSIAVILAVFGYAIWNSCTGRAAQGNAGAGGRPGWGGGGGWGGGDNDGKHAPRKVSSQA